MTYRPHGVGDGDGVGATVAAAAHNGEVLYLRGDPREVVGQLRQLGDILLGHPVRYLRIRTPSLPE